MSESKPNDNAFQESVFGQTYTLTKREYFAILSMQAQRIVNPCIESKEVALAAIEDAEALIAALNKDIE